MNSEKSTESKSYNPFQESDYERIVSFVNRYDSLYAELRVLEERVQGILNLQEVIVNTLNDLRAEEEEFFIDLSAATGFEVKQLKDLAATWATERKTETFLQ